MLNIMDPVNPQSDVSSDRRRYIDLDGKKFYEDAGAADESGWHVIYFWPKRVVDGGWYVAPAHKMSLLPSPLETLAVAKKKNMPSGAYEVYDKDGKIKMLNVVIRPEDV